MSRQPYYATGLMDPGRVIIDALHLTPILTVYPLSRLKSDRLRWIIGVPVCCAALLAPFVVDPDRARRRWRLAMLGFVLWARGLDYLRNRPAPGTRKGGVLRCLIFMTFYPNTMTIDRFARMLHVPRIRFVLSKIGAGVGRAALGFLLFAVGAKIGLPERSWLLNHVFRVSELYLFICAISDIGVGLLGLTGRRADDILRGMLKSRTILDFWARYNMMVHYWLRSHVFERLGGMRRPGLGLFATFAASGLIHEYIFFVAAPDLVGHQSLFFMIQATAGYVEWRVRRRVEVPRWAGRLWTIGFVFLTTPIFFIGLDRIYPSHGAIADSVLRQIGW